MSSEKKNAEDKKQRFIEGFGTVWKIVLIVAGIAATAVLVGLGIRIILWLSGV